MFKTLLARARQGYRTAAYPVQDPGLPALFRGRPVLDPDKCVAGCTACVDVCPTGALRVTESGPELDIGRCIFCGDCIGACPEGAITFTRDWRLAASRRGGLVATGDRPLQIDALARDLRRLLGRSLRLREVSAGGCNGCEVEVNALGNVVFDCQPIRDRFRGFATPRRWRSGDRAGDREHEGSTAHHLPSHCRAQARHRRRSLCNFRRHLSRSRRGIERDRGPPSRRSLRAGLPASPLHNS